MLQTMNSCSFSSRKLASAAHVMQTRSRHVHIGHANGQTPYGGNRMKCQTLPTLGKAPPWPHLEPKAVPLRSEDASGSRPPGSLCL